MIEVSGLNFTYAGSSRKAINNIHFHIDKSEVFGFLGPSGAGKSTTQKILIGLLKDYQGEIRVLGQDLKTWGSDYYERVGVSFELPNHYLKLTALENLHYFRSLYAGETEAPQKLLEMVGLGDEGDKRVAEFSKGMRNRLNVARSLIHRPELLFLDEPTSGLDPVNAKLIKEIIQHKQENGTTIFLTTHNMAVADELCDRVAFIVDGEIKLIDAPRQLKLQHGKRLVRVEYGKNGQLKSQEFPLDELGNNADFLVLLQNETIQTIHTQETTLENIFIEVTGRQLT
jgi:fluoroquinolone transport system ATP-binding protein